MRIAGSLIVFLFARSALADPVGIPAGCSHTATLLMPNCEMHQVLACENGAAARVDVYAGGTFLGEEAYRVTTMTRWRRGPFVQELSFMDGAFDHLATLPAGETREITVTRLRKRIGAEGGPPPERFRYRISVVGPALRDLPGGGDREVRRYRVVAEGDGAEGSDLLIDYDPALGVPVWREGTGTSPDGNGWETDTGPLQVLLAGDTGYMQDSAPEGTACTPE